MDTRQCLRRLKFQKYNGNALNRRIQGIFAAKISKESFIGQMICKIGGRREHGQRKGL